MSITDTMSEGLEYKTGSATVGMPYMKTYQVEPVQNGRTLTWNWNIGDYKLWDDEKINCYVVKYATWLTSGAIAEIRSSGEARSFSNDIVAQIGDKYSGASANQSVSDSDVISKSAKQNGNYIEYTIKVNPHGQDLLDDGDGGTLTLKDTLKNATYDLSSYKVYELDSSQNVTTEEVSVPALKWEGGSLIFTLPDNTPLAVTYSALIDGTNRGDKFHVTNTAELTGGVGGKASHEADYEVKEFISRMWGLPGTMSVLKHATDDAGKSLEGAEFELYKYSDYDFIKVDTATTNASGAATFPSDDNYNDNGLGTTLLTNQLYYIQETVFCRKIC